jgi:hypothetical protein
MAEAPLIGKREFEHQGPVIRLLHCMVDDSIEELPPFDGPPEQDVLLQITLEHHTFESGEPHVGQMFILPIKVWANPETRNEIIRQLKGQGVTGLDAMTPEADFYSTKMTFHEDAMTCWKYHLRPDADHGCGDYKSPQKRLLPKTSKERKDAGLEAPSEAPGPKVFLCNFCPYHSVVSQKRRAIAGLYD